MQRGREAAIFCSHVRPGAEAIRAAITSLSVVVRKVTPCAARDWRRDSELTRFPLWATKMRPRSRSSAKTGWAFSEREPPVVE